MRYMIMTNSAKSACYVKEGEFFDQQVRESKILYPGDEWFKHWQPIEADSIEDARKKGEDLLGVTEARKDRWIWNSEAPGY